MYKLLPFPLFAFSLLICSANGAVVTVDQPASEFVVDVKATAHSFEVKLDAFDVDLALDEEGVPERADFRFACANLESNNGKRDRKMLGWLDTEAHPDIRFSLKDVKPDPDGYVGMGTLTMHGVSKEVNVPFTISENGDKLTINGSAQIDHRDFGLDVITMFFMKVNPKLKISFTLVGTVSQ